MILKAIIGATALATTAAGVGYAEETSWKTWSFDDGKVVEGGDGEVIGLSMASSEEPSISFICNPERGLTAVVAMEPSNFTESIPEMSRRAKRRTIMVTVNDEETVRDRWAYSPVAKTSVPLRESMSRKLYNASVQGHSITLDMAARQPVTVTPPAVDDSFKKFASSCHVTNPKTES